MMAFIKKPFTGEVVTVVSSGTSVASTTGPYENTSSIIVYNTDGTNTVLVEWGANAGPTLSSSSVRIPPSTSMTLPIGRSSSRLTNYTNLLFDTTGGSNIKVEITYVNGLEG